MAANGFRATGLFPCDKNIFRPHDFPLASQDTEAAPVNHPALAKISDQPLFSSANFSPFTSAEALLASDVPVPSLNLQPNTRGGTAQTKSSTQKKKIKQATISETSRLALNTLLGPSKKRKRRVCRDPTPCDMLSDSDTDVTGPFADDSTEEEEQDADCVYCTGRFSEDRSGEEWIRCTKCCRWAHILGAGKKEDFVCEPCQG